MRIALTGVHSSGKSTLLEALATEKEFFDYHICKEVTRFLKQSGIPINEAGNDVTQVLVINQHIANIALYENMLVDRSIIDGLLYTYYLYQQGQVSKEVMNYARHAYDSIIGKYDFIFYLEPLTKNAAEDGVRSTRPDFYVGMKNLFAQFLENKLPECAIRHDKGKVFHLPPVSIADRVRIIKSTLAQN